MASFVPLLGDTLVQPDGSSVPTSGLDCEVLALYFSAVWCGPCQAFTPVLSDKYSSLKADGKKFQVVFVSSDKSQEDFDGYFKKMPWLALPFAQRDVKKMLSRKFKVRGIPTLVLLAADGSVISTEGREEIMQPEKFPWPQPTLGAVLGPAFANKEGGETTLASIQESGSHIGLYFSAHWCPPCRQFTPELISAYKAVKEAGKNFEMVFVSSDRKQEEFDEYFGEMPWLAVPLAEKERKMALSKIFGVEGIPSLVILDSQLNVVNKGARAAVNAKTAVEDFPWEPKLVQEPDDGDMDGIEDDPCVIVLLEGVTGDSVGAVEGAVKEVAEAAKAAAVAVGEPLGVRFMVCRETGGIGGQLRKICDRPRRAGPAAEMLVMDLDDEGAYYLPAAGAEEVTAANLQAMVDGFKAKTLERKQAKSQ